LNPAGRRLVAAVVAIVIAFVILEKAMRSTSLIVLAACGALASIPASAADADLNALREEIAQMKQAYEQRIKALESRLEKAETTVVKAEASATQAQASARQAGARPAPANAFNPEISLILQGRYKDMKEVPERTITGFWPAAGHDHGGGAGEANQRGFSLDHSELVFRRQHRSVVARSADARREGRRGRGRGGLGPDPGHRPRHRTACSSSGWRRPRPSSNSAPSSGAVPIPGHRAQQERQQQRRVFAHVGGDLDRRQQQLARRGFLLATRPDRGPTRRGGLARRWDRQFRRRARTWRSPTSSGNGRRRATRRNATSSCRANGSAATRTGA
jgi:hypothetical protein